MFKCLKEFKSINPVGGAKSKRSTLSGCKNTVHDVENFKLCSMIDEGTVMSILL